jgi:hypothetical protein
MGEAFAVVSVARLRLRAHVLGLSMHAFLQMARAQFQQQWSAVAHDVGTGRSAWQCHRRWGMLLQSPEGSANPSQQLTAKTDKQVRCDRHIA